jgi:lipid A 3-O-deacylase
MFDNKIARKILLATPKGKSSFALSLRQNGFTPEELTLSQVDSSDRPYAGTLTLTYLQSSQILNQQWKYNTGFRLGVSGPSALIKELQTSIHKSTGGTIPQGWDNQIANSLIIQYAAMGEKQFLSFLPHVRLGIGSYGEIGSFLNYIVGFASLKLGWFHQDYLTFNTVRYRKSGTMNKWQLYLNCYFSGRYILYDGTLQGGLIPFEKSPYTLTWGDYEHFTPQATYTITLSYKNFQIQYYNRIEIDRYLTDDIFAFGAIGISFPIGRE